MPGVARARYSLALSCLPLLALASAVVAGLPSCKEDPVRRRTSDAGLSLLPDGGVDSGPAAGGLGEIIPGLEGLGVDPEQLDPGLLPPGIADAGLVPPDLGLGGGGSPLPPLGGLPTSSEPGGVVGRPCTSNADCGAAPLFCIPSSSNNSFQTGGPQGGFCSLPCSGNAECQRADARSGCNTQLGFCLGLCTPGASADKCDLVRPLACVPEAQTGGVCLPTCTSDEACGAGRFCDLGATGLCQDAPPAGGVVGAPCTRQTESADCEGDICLTVVDPLDGTTPVGSFCSANCTFGRLDGCGFDTLSSGTRTAACLEPQAPGSAPGDLGFCVELCDDASDCEQGAEGWVCEPFADPSQASALGRAGRCQPLELAGEPDFPGFPEDDPEGIPGFPDLPGIPELRNR